MSVSQWLLTRWLLLLAFLRRTDVVMVREEISKKISFHLVRSGSWDPFEHNTHRYISIRSNGAGKDLLKLEKDGTILAPYPYSIKLSYGKAEPIPRYRWIYLNQSKAVFMNLRGEDE